MSQSAARHRRGSSILRRALGIGTVVVLASGATAAHAAGGSGGGTPDLSATITANPAVVVPGGSVQWTINVTNGGTAAAGGFDVTFPGGSAGIYTGTGWTCTWTGASKTSAAKAVCHIGSLAAGATSTLTTTRTAPFSAGPNTITGTVDSGLAVTESNETNNVAVGSFVVSINGQYDFVATHTSSALSPSLPTEPITYTTNVVNVGPYQGFTTVTLTDQLPIGFSFQSWSATVTSWDPAIGVVFTSPGSVSCTPSGTPVTGVLVTCTGVPNSIPMSTQTAVVRIVALPAAADGLVDYTATDVVTVDSDNAFAEVDETNNTQSLTARITNMLPDLTLTVAPVPATVDPGAIIDYEYTISNVGTAIAPDATMSFNRLAGAWVSGGANGEICSSVLLKGVVHAGCGGATLAPGESVTFPVQLKASGLVGTYSTIAVANVGGARSVPAGADNIAEATTSVIENGPVDLSATVFTPGLTAVDQPTSLTITVPNTGIGTSAATTIEATLPVGFTFDPASDFGLCTLIGQVVSCPLSAAPPGRSQVVTMNVVTPHPPGDYIVGIVVDPAGLVAESNETNNTAAAAITSSAAFADLVATIAGPATAPINGKVIDTVTVTNSGASLAAAPSLLVYAPAFARVDSFVAPAGWTCVVGKIKTGGNSIMCTGGPLANGASVDVQLTFAGAYNRGVATISTTVDYMGTLQELSELNNIMSFTTTIV